MAIPSWLTVSPTSGNKNASVTVTAAAHTGRSNRSYTLSVKSSAGTPQKTATVAITQSAKAEFLTINTIAKQPASGNISINVTGTSNADKIQLLRHPSANTVEQGMTPTKYSVNGTTYNSGAVITGDPGATAQYTWSVSVDIPVNQSVSDQTYRFGIKTTNTDTQFITITQSGCAPTLSLDKTTATIAQAGGSTTVAVTSNTTWAVS